MSYTDVSLINKTGKTLYLIGACASLKTTWYKTTRNSQGSGTLASGGVLDVTKLLKGPGGGCSAPGIGGPLSGPLAAFPIWDTQTPNTLPIAYVTYNTDTGAVKGGMLGTVPLYVLPTINGTILRIYLSSSPAAFAAAARPFTAPEAEEWLKKYWWVVVVAALLLAGLITMAVVLGRRRRRRLGK